MDHQHHQESIPTDRAHVWRSVMLALVVIVLALCVTCVINTKRYVEAGFCEQVDPVDHVARWLKCQEAK